MRAVLCLTLLCLAEHSRAQAIQDSRCYLMNGGAVESFFISEDTPVGSVIGALSVNGDPSEEQGDITLRLQEKGAAIGISPGTKNLTLLRALDREEKKGPSNVYVNVRCDRRRTTDPSFIIPVSIRVWDVNDNAPVWQGAPYKVRLSELTAVGTRVAVGARATDADQPGPHATIHYSILPGPHSNYLGFPNELDSVLTVKKPLDYETLKNFTITLRAQDAGTPPLHNDTELRVQVLDADDQNPKFSHEHYTAVLPEDVKEGAVLPTSPGSISAVDQDVGINAPLQYSATGDNGRLITIDKDTGQVSATKQLIEELNQPVTVVIKATQVDNSDRYALATLSIRRAGPIGGIGSSTPAPAGADPVRFRRKQFSASVSEAAAPGHVVLTLNTVPPANSLQNNLQFYVSDRSFLEKFAINSAGEVVLRRALDYEDKDGYYYQVMLTDGISNDTASVNISVINVNEWEPRFKYPQYEFRVEEDTSDETELLPVGKLDVFDGDKLDSVSLTLRGSGSEMLYVNSSGDMFLRAGALRSLNASVLHVVATAVDSGAPPRQTSVPVTVHVSERLLQGVEGGGRVQGSAGVVALFAAALAALAVLVCALLLYIYTVRRRSKQTTGYVAHEKPPQATTTAAATPPATAPTAPSAGEPSGVTGVLAGGSAAAGGAPALRASGSAGSLLSVSAGASTILANSTSSLDLHQDTQHNAAVSGRQSQRFPRSKVAPLAPSLASNSTALPPASGVSLMSDHLCGREAGRSGVAWPSATIPARVKKLSWDDSSPDGQNKWGGGDRRDQSFSRRPHESHRLLLTDRDNECAALQHAQEQTFRNISQVDRKEKFQDVTAGIERFPEDFKSKTSGQGKQDFARPTNCDEQNYTNISGHLNSPESFPRTVALAQNTERFRRALNIPNTYSIRSSGQRKRASFKSVSPVNTHKTSALPASTSDSALNTVGIPAYNNHLLFDENMSASSSPSNCPTMVADHKREHPKFKDVAQYIHSTIPSSNSNKSSTKHLKPPKNKLKSSLTTPTNQSIRINRASSNYAIPIPNQNVLGMSPPVAVASSAPIMYESPDFSDSLPGSPLSYATVDPRKLRTKHIKPLTFGLGSPRYQPL